MAIEDAPSGPTMLSLYDRTTVMCEPWAEAGFNCIAVDIQHTPGVHREGNIWRVGVDVRRWLPPLTEYVFVAAFPPCTNLAVSGARWFRSKGIEGLIEGLELVQRAIDVCEWSQAPWFIENPVSTISSYWRKPDHHFHPYEYGGWCDDSDDGYFKKTCLWVGGGFSMPDPKPVEIDDPDRIHHAPPSDDRGDIRSMTPRGFARAVFHANAP